MHIVSIMLDGLVAQPGAKSQVCRVRCAERDGRNLFTPQDQLRVHPDLIVGVQPYQPTQLIVRAAGGEKIIELGTHERTNAQPDPCVRIVDGVADDRGSEHSVHAVVAQADLPTVFHDAPFADKLFDLGLHLEVVGDDLCETGGGS